MSRDYTCTIRVKASAGQAFEAISDIAKWWATNFEGRAKFPGDRFRVRFGKTYSVMEVTESDPEKKLPKLSGIDRRGPARRRSQ
jgi:hypothetical protein